MQISATDNLLSQNVRTLLWQRNVPRSDWIRHLAGLLPPTWGATRVAQLLTGSVANSDDAHDLSKALEIEVDQLIWEDLISAANIDVLKENLDHLIGSLERGGKKRLAADLELDPTTISRWLSGAIKPQGSTLNRLTNYFGLPSQTDLRTEPVFLSLDPVSLPERRRWLSDRIDTMSAGELRDLYPALQRLLSPR